MKQLFSIMLACFMAISANAAKDITETAVSDSAFFMLCGDPYNPLKKSIDNISKKWDISISVPKGFSEYKEIISFVYNHKDRKKLRFCEIFSPCLISNDRQCIIGLTEHNLMICNGNKNGTAQLYIKTAIYGIADTTNNKKVNFSDYVTTLSPTASRRIANADAVHIIDLPLGHAINGKWTAYKMICIEKVGRPVAMLGIFLTKKGEEKTDQYIQAALGIYRYGNDPNWTWPKP